MKDKSIINEAEKILNLEQVKQAVKDMKDYIPYIAEMTMDIYEGFIEKGFTEERAFSFAKDCVLGMILLKN